MGVASVQKLFDVITVERKDKSKPARDFNDYTISVAKDDIPQGVTLIEKL
jgi:CRISPR-associated protein Csd2